MSLINVQANQFYLGKGKVSKYTQKKLLRNPRNLKQFLNIPQNKNANQGIRRRVDIIANKSHFIVICHSLLQFDKVANM